MSDNANHIVPFPNSAVDSIDSVNLQEQFEMVELERRSVLIAQRDSISTDEARTMAQSWLSKELGTGQLSFPIDKYTYCIHYLSKQQSTLCKAVYAETDIQLYDWPVVKKWLTEIVQQQFDALCESVVTFYDVTDSLHKNSIKAADNADEKSLEQDKLNKERIAELERQLAALKSAIDDRSE